MGGLPSSISVHPLWVPMTIDLILERVFLERLRIPGMFFSFHWLTFTLPLHVLHHTYLRWIEIVCLFLFLCIVCEFTHGFRRLFHCVSPVCSLGCFLCSLSTRERLVKCKRNVRERIGERTRKCSRESTGNALVTEVRIA